MPTSSIQKSISTPTNDEAHSARAPKTTHKNLEAAVRDTAIQMGCWAASDDYLLIMSVLHLCDLERVHERVKFSMAFTLQNIQDRWQCLLYHAPISKMIVTKIQQLSMSQIANLRIPFNDEEEQLLAAIPSHTVPAVLDDELDRCLSQHSPEFWSNRTIDELRDCWIQMRQESRLNDQREACLLFYGRELRLTLTPFICLAQSQSVQSFAEKMMANKLSNVLAPYEFELLSHNQEKFAGKKELPQALLYTQKRLYCMYTEQLTFGTGSPGREFDIAFDNSTTVHIQGMIVRKSGSFYVINNGDHAFRVNDALLNSNEASPLGARAVINIFEHVMAFQALELP